MKFSISFDERYPDGDLVPYCGAGASIELTDEEYQEWLRVKLEYNKWQDRFDKAAWS